MIRHKSLFIIIILSLSLTSHWTHAGSFEDEAFKISQNAIGHVLGNYTLIDQDGKPFDIKSLTGQPLVISFIYTSCKYACPAITLNLSRAFKKAKRDVGNKFKILTIGFDTQNDTPSRIKKYGENFTQDFKNWIFATGNKDTIGKIARDIGFKFRKKANGKFDHLNMVTVLDRKGKVYRQVYGLDFEPSDIVDTIKLILNNEKFIPPQKAKSLIGRLKLFCYTYDERLGTYKINYGAITAIVLSSIFQLATIITIIYLLRRSRRQRT